MPGSFLNENTAGKKKKLPYTPGKATPLVKAEKGKKDPKLIRKELEAQRVEDKVTHENKDAVTQKVLRFLRKQGPPSASLQED